MLFDTHCHIHDSEFFLENREQAYQESRDANVTMVCVGTNQQSSLEAITFSEAHPGCYPVVGIHPHESADADISAFRELVETHKNTIVGIGEIGLDYFYTHSPREVQLQVLRDQLQIAVDYNLPVSFHVREAFDDFWPVFDEFPSVRGILHSFTDTQENLDKAIKRSLYIGVNGISTFTKSPEQRKLFKDVPLEYIVLETDAPFLTPAPFRGKMNKPAYVAMVAQHQAELKEVSLDYVVQVTTANAQGIFGIQ